MGFFDDLLGGVGDFIGGLFGSGIGDELINIGGQLLSPAIAEALYGSTDPSSFLTPEQREAVRLSNEARQINLNAGRRIMGYATPEMQESIVRREAARHALERDMLRRRQVARGVRTPFTHNYYDNVDPIVRAALSLSDPYTRAADFAAQAAGAASGLPSYQGPQNAAALAVGADMAREADVQGMLGRITPSIVNVALGGGGRSPVSGFADTGGRYSSGQDLYGRYYGMLI